VPPFIRALAFITPSSIEAPPSVPYNHLIVAPPILIQPTSVYGDERNALHKISYTTIIIPLSINTLQQIGLPRIYVNVRIIPNAIRTKQIIPKHKIVVPTSPGYISGYIEIPQKIKNDIEVYMSSSYTKMRK
jgi:hypothetical protein